jgi:polyisoprenoid-binding protein YceI
MANKIKWLIDKTQSNISFKVGGLIFSSVVGRFKTFDAQIITNSNNFETAIIELQIDPSSITTGDSTRDAHLKSQDFFDAFNFTQILFKSNSIGGADSNGNHNLTGDLTIKDSTHSIDLNVKFSEITNDRWGNEKAGFILTGNIHRQDWGLTWNSSLKTGGFLVSEEAVLSCEIQLINAENKFAV